MLAWTVEHLYTGSGAICELGSFMGGSTVHLACGLERNLRSRERRLAGGVRRLLRRPSKRRVVESFDGFELAGPAKDAVLGYWGFPSFEGEDLLPMFLQYTAEYSDYVRAHKADVTTVEWSDPIEILFVDCCKDWWTNDAVARTFYTKLVPNRSTLIQQDYLHFQHPWVVATMEALYPRLRPIAHTASNSMVFGCYEAVTERDLAAATGMEADVGAARELILRAQSRHEDAAVKTYLGQHLAALAKNPAPRFSWDLTL